MPKRNYHMCLGNRGEGQWRCDYCGAEGTLEELRANDCTHVYETCVHCGGCEESNECKPDCAGVWAELAREDVYIAGSHQGN